MERRGAVWVQIQRSRRVIAVEIFCNPHRHLPQPLRQRLVAHALRHNRADRHGVGVQTLIFGLQDVFSDETPLCIRTARVLDRRVHVDRKAVPHAPDLDVLIKARFVAIFGKNPNVALAKRHLVVARGVVSHVSIRDVLNVTDHAVKNLSDLNVRLVVGWDDVRRRPVLPLLVGHLAHVLRQLVDRQAWPRVDCLPLHRPAH